MQITDDLLKALEKAHAGHMVGHDQPKGGYSDGYVKGFGACIESARRLIAAAPAAPAPAAQEPVAYCSDLHMRMLREGSAFSVSVQPPAWRDSEIDKHALYAATPAAEQPYSTTSDKYRAELYDEVWAQARMIGFGNVTMALADLERRLAAERPAAEQPECGCCGKTGPCDPDCDAAEQPDTVTVPRELLRQAVSDDRTLRATARFALRALLAGGEA